MQPIDKHHPHQAQNEKPRRKILGFCWRFAKFSILLFLFLSLIIAIALLIGPDRIIALQGNINNTWWIVSVLRWIIIALIIIYLPTYCQKITDRKSQEFAQLQNEIDLAQSQNAAYETLNALERKANDAAKIARSYELLRENKYWAAGLFIALELVAVQLPHFI